MKTSLKSVVLVGLSALCLLMGKRPVEAGLTFTLQNVTSPSAGVLLSGSGSLNMSGWSPFLAASGTNGAFRNAGSPPPSDRFNARVGNDPSPSANRFNIIGTATLTGSFSGTPTYASPAGNVLFADSTSGDRFQVEYNPLTSPVSNQFFVSLPSGYSGGALNGTAFFAGQSLATFGMNNGDQVTFSFTTGGNQPETIVVKAVPEPSIWALTGVGVACAAAWSKIRRRRQN